MAWFGKSKKSTIVENSDKDKVWNKDLKRNNSIANSSEQQGFDFKENTDTSVVIDTSSTKKGPSCNLEKISSDQVEILKKCKLESSAEELIKILKRTHKTRFKNDILNPLLGCEFFERTIPEKPKSPKQKYRLTSKFVRAKSS
ncbi:ATP-dependent DNA helicase [uncultured Candidatus Thioglobus sp.]|nr:ATP-dependent DNA helicase [uncultured Candidatus Thioglobus sp.]